MNLTDADNAAHRLVAHHLAGQGWRIRWNQNKGRLGVCKYGTKTLEFSAPHFRFLSVEEAVDTILHEIAHALVGGGHGHDAVWARQHRAIGGSAQRGHTSPEEVKEAIYKWVLTCQNCGVKVYRNRLAKGYKEKGCWHPSCGKVKGQMTITAMR